MRVQQKETRSMPYPKLKILNDKEKREIVNKLRKQFGVEEVEGTLVKRGKDRVFLFKGDLGKKGIEHVEYMRVCLERVGIYFAKKLNDDIRLSIEGVQVLKTQFTKNIYELNDEQALEWMKGDDILIDLEEEGEGYGLYIMKHKDEFLGCGKASVGRIGNFVPKSRRLKK